MQHEDGTLGVCPVDSVRNAFTKVEKVEANPLTGSWTMQDGKISCESRDGYSAALGGHIPKQCCIKAKCRFYGAPERFGLALQVDEKFDFGYYLMFEPGHHRIQFRSGLRMYENGGQMFPYAVELERPLPLEEGKEYQLELYLDGTLAVLYVDQDLAFGFRMYNYQGRKLGFFVSDGDIEITDACIWGCGRKVESDSRSPCTYTK